MTPFFFSIPTEHEELIPWLEKAVTGIHLGTLVSELAVIHGTHQPELGSVSVSLQEICGDSLSEVLEQGLKVLRAEQIQLLMTHPASLLELQEQAFVNGSAYWTDLADGGTAGHFTQSISMSAVFSGLQLDSDTLTSVRQTTQPEVARWSHGDVIQDASQIDAPRRLDVPRRDTRRAGVRLRIFVLTCSAVLVVAAMWMLGPHKPPGWGFERSGLLTSTQSEKDFLSTLAMAGDDWFNRRPSTSEELIERLTAFSRGCQTLIEAPLPQLTTETRTWLREKCGKWKTTVDGSIATLQQSPDSYGRVLEESDATIRRMIQVLTERARQAV
ncbi:MAG: hypothetical protein ACK526_06925 [Planctomyces sp.]